MNFDLEVDMPSLTELANKYTLNNEQHQKVSEAGARYLKVGITDALKYMAKETGGSKSRTVNGITYNEYAQHFPGIENSMYLEPVGRDMGVSIDKNMGHYWHWLEEGHYVVDNRGGRQVINGRTVRNYKYRLSTLNDGNRRFQGLHFIEQGVATEKTSAVNAMRTKFIEEIKMKGGM
ncbi:MAG: hypothetical protein LBT37_04120 [Lactobacillaceae bacterium]|jgi:hypothetical protein|nr:hypothetical protein [Lactobacillaceae bacterium]